MNVRKLAKAAKKLTMSVVGRSEMPAAHVGPYADQPYYSMYEGCLHELAHHIVLNQGWVPGRRKTSIGSEIDELTLVVKMANEIDTLAIEHIASVLLGEEIPIEALVRDACDAGNILLIREADALGMVRESVENDKTNRLGELLADEIQQVLHRI